MMLSRQGWNIGNIGNIGNKHTTDIGARLTFRFNRRRADEVQRRSSACRQLPSYLDVRFEAAVSEAGTSEAVKLCVKTRGQLFAGSGVVEDSSRLLYLHTIPRLRPSDRSLFVSEYRMATVSGLLVSWTTQHGDRAKAWCHPPISRGSVSLSQTRGHGECLVPPHTRGSVSLLSESSRKQQLKLHCKGDDCKPLLQMHTLTRRHCAAVPQDPRCSGAS